MSVIEGSHGDKADEIIIRLATVLAFFLLVRLTEYAANILAVNLDDPVELDPIASEAYRLAELLEQDICRLVLDIELAAQV